MLKYTYLFVVLLVASLPAQTNWQAYFKQSMDNDQDYLKPWEKQPNHAQELLNKLQDEAGNYEPHYNPAQIWGHQQVVLDWTREYQSELGKTFATAKAITVDSQGNPVITGYISNGRNGFDMRTQKFSFDGQLIWEDRYNGPANSDDTGDFIDQDKHGNVYVAGISCTTDGLSQLLVIKYDQDGNRLWLKNVAIQESRKNVLISASLTESRNLYLLTSDLSCKNNPIIIKLSAGGEVQWKFSPLSYWDIYPLSNFILDADENFYLAVSIPGDSIRLNKFSKQGEILWQDAWSSESEYGAQTLILCAAPMGNVFTVWTAQEDIRLGIRMLSASGQYLWNKFYSEPQLSVAATVSTDSVIHIISTSREDAISYRSFNMDGQVLQEHFYYQTEEGNLYINPSIYMRDNKLYGQINQRSIGCRLFTIDKMGQLEWIAPTEINRASLSFHASNNFYMDSNQVTYLCGHSADNEAIISIIDPNSGSADHQIKSPGGSWLDNQVVALYSSPQDNIYCAVNDHSYLYLQKLDSRGNLLWQKQLFDLHGVYRESADFDGQGNLYVRYEKAEILYLLSINTQGNITGQNQIVQDPDWWSVFQVRLGQDGKQVVFGTTYQYADSISSSGISLYFFDKHLRQVSRYKKSFTNTSNAFIYDLTLDDEGSAYIVYVASGGPDRNILKISNSGKEIWEYEYDSELNVFRSKIYADPFGNCYVYNTEVEKDYLDYKLKILKFNTLGQKIFDKIVLEVGSFFWEPLFVMDHQSNLIFSLDLSMGGSDKDCQLFKFSPDGEMLWQTHYDAYGFHEYTDHLKTDAQNNIYIAGLAYKTEDRRESYCAKISAEGQLRWSQSSTTNPVEYTYVTDMEIQSSGSVIIAEQTSGSRWFDSWQHSRFLAYSQTDSDQVIISDHVKLHQNAPNPFNNQSTIQFELPAPDKVSMRIFNSLGQEVYKKNLGMQSAGSHYLHFNASSWASGVYFYRLKACETVKTKKMVLVH